MAFDPDHALALLLQARFNQEVKGRKSTDKENLPVPIKRPLAKTSLVDPEWETTDPCPDIHGLFLAFNDRFFWGRLLGVEVKWSPKMTSCAGVCVYEGKNGLCSVRLSAPLLKLRPRSDLVETLLHEMIHAFLFVTHNNRDRDGHGPEFHKHMNRINKEAGTNISVYHSFHAEVKVYQQHWWRCDGPCQHRAPFFGMVKRANNRAPGPYDMWWADHQRGCGGQFIKVRQPENYKDKNKGKKTVASKGEKDIRNFFQKTGTTNTSGTATSSQVGSNIFGFNNFSSMSNSTTDVKSSTGGTPLNRVVGFKDLSLLSRNGTNQNPSSSLGKGYVLGAGPAKNSTKGSGKINGHGVGRGVGGMLANKGGGTLVVTGSQGANQSTDKPESPNTKLRIDRFQVFSGSGFTLGGQSNKIDRSKSKLLSIGKEPEQKRAKVDPKNEKSRKSEPFGSCKDEDDNRMVKCSVCNTGMLREEVDMHLESCAGLQNVFNNSTVVEVTDDNEIEDLNKKYKVTSCPVCALHIEGDINSHLDECLNRSGILNMFEEPVIEISDSESPIRFLGKDIPKPQTNADNDIEIVESESRVPCPICGMRFGESRINNHVNQCLDSD